MYKNKYFSESGVKVFVYYNAFHTAGTYSIYYKIKVVVTFILQLSRYVRCNQQKSYLQLA